MNGLDFGTAIGLIKGLGSPDPAVIESAVSDWLDDHPEATTTVQDGSITKAKLDSNLQGTVDDVADLKSQMGVVDAVALGAYPTDSASGAVASFSDGGDNLPVKDLTIAIEPVQSGSGDPSPDNVRPISGWTGAKVGISGDSIYDKSTNTADKYINPNGALITANGYSLTDYIPVEGVFVYSGYTATSSSIKTAYYNASKERVGLISLTTGINVVPIDDAVAYIRVSLRSNDVDNFKVYCDNVHSITFPTEAGTVYGGTLDVTTGVLTVDRVMVNMDALSWQYFPNTNPPHFGATTANIKLPVPNGNLICNCYKTVVDSPYANVNNTIRQSGEHNNKGIKLSDTRFTSQPDFVAWLNTAHPQLVYSIDVPQTYQLTPVEVLTLLGANTIYADTGDITVTYRADPTLYADKRSKATRSIIAGIEPTMTASKAYTTGQLLIVGDTLYKVVASIASGATLTPGTNVNPTTVAEQLILLANA